MCSFGPSENCLQQRPLQPKALGFVSQSLSLPWQDGAGKVSEHRWLGSPHHQLASDAHGSLADVTEQQWEQRDVHQQQMDLAKGQEGVGTMGAAEARDEGR